MVMATRPKILPLCLLAALLLFLTLSLPAAARDFKIALDIGHTPDRGGAVSARGVPEYLFNKTVATLLLAKLRQDPQFRASFIINPGGDDISLTGRAAVANSRRADLFLSLHHDSVEVKDLSQWQYQGEILDHCDKFTGHSVFFSAKNPHPKESLRLAQIIGSEMLAAGFRPTLHHAEKFTGGDKDLVDKTRGIYKYNNIVVLYTTDMPAVLFECGIIKNRAEEIKLCNPRYQHQITAVLYRALKKYCQSLK